MSPLLTDIAISIILIVGISQFRTPRSARFGNLTAAFALLCAAVIVLLRHPPTSLPLLLFAAAIGVAAGWLVAARIHMIALPAMVAFQHGMGGVAAVLVSFVELSRPTDTPLRALGEISAILGLAIGAATFSGSLIASGKLANRLRQTPVLLPNHNVVLLAVAAITVLLMIVAGAASGPDTVKLPSVLVIAAAVALGIVVAIRIGGADMPVLISFLNATAGLAAALCGVAIGNRLLIVSGATVAASGSILTHVMCRAMNRPLLNIFAGPASQRPRSVTVAPSPSPAPSTPANAPAPPPTTAPAQTPSPAAPPADAVPADPFAHALAVLRSARLIIIIPGYGMALAEAQEEVAHLADRLTGLGKEVVFAVHPVAGRMPGHMHVLLAEAEVDYGRIHELQDVNPRFAQTDVALVIGACDVVNPAAIQRPDTPISGMPILLAHQARNVIVCNLDARPGYSGVDNPLYHDPKTILLLGDAKVALARMLDGL